MQVMLEVLLFLIWSAFFIATLLGVWSDPAKPETSTPMTGSPSGSTANAMEMANQLW